jgi:hypothetical protein
VALALLAFARVDRPPTAEVPELPEFVIIPTNTPNPLATATPDVRPRTRTQLDVRLGPGNAFAIVGVLTRGQAVDVVGRDSTSEWLAIRFPPDSVARGWVPVSQLDGVGDLEGVTVAAPTPLARTLATPPLSGRSPFDFSGNDGLAQDDIPLLVTPTPSLRRVTPTPDAAALPDLVVSRIGLLADGRVSVTIGNRGPGSTNGALILVLVRDLSSRSEQMATNRELDTGDTVTLQTQNFTVDHEMDIQAIVDHVTSLKDSDRSNNSLRITLSPPPTPTPVRRNGQE